MDPQSAGDLQKSLELLHIFSYFSPIVHEEYALLGASNTRQGYWASRIAPMGQVGSEIVYATFYSFAKKLVFESFDHAWEIASPQQWIIARHKGTLAQAEKIFAGIDINIFTQLSSLLSQAAQSIYNYGGRPLAAAYIESQWPEHPIMQAWHCQTILREFRGDGHIIALINAGLTGLEALIINSSTGMRFNRSFAYHSRGYSEQEWNAAEEKLLSHKLLDSPGALSTSGWELFNKIEQETDRLGYEPWRDISDDQAQEITLLWKPLRSALLNSGLFRPEVFAWAKELS